MTSPDRRLIYYCDFRLANGSDLAIEQPVRDFVEQPSYFVVVEGVGFRKSWESGNRVAYVQVSMIDLTNKVVLNTNKVVLNG